VRNLLGGAAVASHARTPEIVADAAHWILTQPSRECSGNFFIDDLVLEKAGVNDLSRYEITPGEPLFPDFFVPDGTPLPAGGPARG
jgi:citronellol/citronellal dehydrogenase